MFAIGRDGREGGVEGLTDTGWGAAPFAGDAPERGANGGLHHKDLAPIVCPRGGEHAGADEERLAFGEKAAGEVEEEYIGIPAAKFAPEGEATAVGGDGGVHVAVGFWRRVRELPQLSADRGDGPERGGLTVLGSVANDDVAAVRMPGDEAGQLVPRRQRAKKGAAQERAFGTTVVR